MERSPQMAILPGEDPREFDELHSALIEEWAPAGPTEQDAVLTIAKCVWRKRPMQKFLDAKIEAGRFEARADPLYDKSFYATRALFNFEAETPIPELSERIVDDSGLNASFY